VTDYAIVHVTKTGLTDGRMTWGKALGKKTMRVGQVWAVIRAPEGIYPIVELTAPVAQSDPLTPDGAARAILSLSGQDRIDALQAIRRDGEAAKILHAIEPVAAMSQVLRAQRIGPDELLLPSELHGGVVPNVSLNGRRITLRPVPQSTIKPVDGRLVLPGLNGVSPFHGPVDILLHHDDGVNGWTGVLNQSPGIYGIGLGASRSKAVQWDPSTKELASQPPPAPLEAPPSHSPPATPSSPSSP
jgi:hypothetical protein